MRLFILVVSALVVTGCGAPKPGQTQVREAIEQRNLESLGTWYTAHPEALEEPLGKGTPLYYAARVGAVTSAEKLIDLGADVGFVDSRGWGVLYMAAQKGHADVCQLLIERGADINAATREPPGWTALHVTSYHGETAVVEVLLKNGADRTLTIQEGFTALDLATAAGHRDIARLLADEDSQGQRTR